ncbi:hypothetical protein O0L34_g15156 [Tuta absoluta]|nr:hypothetical protein O0L34_g15156 [Tuta absoluta]
MVVILILLSALAGVLFILYTLSKRNLDYWKQRNVPHLKPLPLFGNYFEYMTLRKTNFEVAQEICQQFPKESYIGTYFGTKPALIIQDPKIIKLITTKDHAYFSGRDVSKYCDREVITKNMFFTHGDNWKVLRQNLSPLFTVSKVKNMFPLIQNCVKTFENMLERELSMSNVLEGRSLMARFTIDCIGSVVFGINTDTMSKDITTNPFIKMANIIFDNSNIRGIAVYTRLIWPSLFYGLGLYMFPKSIYDFFRMLILGVFQERQYKPSMRNDFVDLLLNLKQQDYIMTESILKSKKGETFSLEINDELLIAQVVLLFGAGFETSAATTSFALFQLAKNQDAQKRAHKEVDEYLKRKKGKIDYDCTSEMPYLEACIEESMRLYPALGIITREVMETYELPSGLILEPGTSIHLPVYQLHHNPEYFPNPEKYRPERFLPENKAHIIPYTYMPFGEGQRICLGIRVAKMMMIPGLMTVLRKYRVELTDGMTKELNMEPRAILTMCKEELQLKFIPREQ